jgi:hypothetical protein
MKKALIAVLSAVVFATGFALAAPVFHFNTDSMMNVMMNAMMKKDVIQIAAFPKLGLVSQHVNRSKRTLVYSGNNLNGAYDFYDQALGMNGWKATPAMGLENGLMKDGNYEGTYAKLAFIRSQTRDGSCAGGIEHQVVLCWPCSKAETLRLSYPNRSPCVCRSTANAVASRMFGAVKLLVGVGQELLKAG